ncbi:protein of unknown function DUF115 [Thermodesulfatator indicus DSM 15286]|uniref:DUF115 domain-containing protein n=1 Tax=Thermodesulfatator indicus (strain DSM 15286 / JCM 11887 / CIR29812) TaxID=667014 RepID=F8A864_THEID|nr:6-hydroxymethylpterin diphosphokinase MptE-like protein [Thermodesulfatator indicus]AEH44332.1 protein of unknown function DUF115 [Thermodesulfatator indicus DSM 15286]
MNIQKQLEEKFKKNLAFFEKEFPEIYEKLLTKGKPKVEIDIISTTQINLIVDNAYVYPVSPKHFSLTQVENFLKSPRSLKSPASLSVPELETIVHTYLRKLCDSFASLGGKEENDFSFDGQNMQCLLMEGLLFGYQLEFLLDRLNIKNLVILEMDVELFKPSLYVLDWPKIARYFKEPGRRLDILIEDDPENLAKALIRLFIEDVSFLYFSFAYNFSMFRSPFWEKFEEKFLYFLQAFFRGWGFYDDEVVSLIHTLKNISQQVPVINLKKKLVPNCSACIVGSGPSLDAQLEWLREKRNSLVIFSCGTATKALEKADIKPDFHVELERTAVNYTALNLVKKEFLEEIPIIASCNVDSRIFSLTREPIMFPKYNDVGGKILYRYGKFEELAFCNPTVTNTGLALAINMGFKEIYLAGVDLGFIEPERHHSTKTIYYDEKSRFNIKKLEDTIPYERKDGKIVYTTGIFLYTKQVMEFLLKQYPVKVYNLSDTLPIEGTIPVSIDKACPNGRKDLIPLEELASNRYQAKIKPLEIAELVLASSARNLKLMKEAFSTELKTPHDLFVLIDNLWEIQKNWEKENEISHIMFGGSVKHFQHLLLTCSFKLPPEKFQGFVEGAKKVFIEFADKALANLEVLRDKIAAGELEEIKPNVLPPSKVEPVFYVLA